MWLSKKYCFISLIVAYGFLIMLFFVLRKEEIIETPCSWRHPCVRFCCANTTLCKDDFIRKNFKANFSEYSDDDDDEKPDSFIVLHGTPKCKLRDMGTEIRRIVYVSKIFPQIILNFFLSKNYL